MLHSSAPSALFACILDAYKFDISVCQQVNLVDARGWAAGWKASHFNFRKDQARSLKSKSLLHIRLSHKHLKRSPNLVGSILIETVI